MEGLIASTNISIKGSTIEFNGRKINLDGCPLTLRLFKFLASSPDQTRSRDEVLREIYGSRLDDCVSNRLARSNRHNLVKLISRSRSLAKNKLSGTSTNRLRWFAFDQIDDAWTLLVEKKATHHHS